MSNNKDLGRRKKWQTKAKAQKQAQFLANKLTYQKLTKLFEPGRLFVLNRVHSLAEKNGRTFLNPGTVVLCLGIGKYTNNLDKFCLKLLVGDRVGHIYENAKFLQEMFVPVKLYEPHS
jgi:hypothetical protein